MLAGLGVSTLTLPLSLTSGCDLVTPGADGEATPGADELLLEEVSASTSALLARVRAAATTAPRRASDLAALGDALQVHLDRFTSAPPDATSPTSAPSPTTPASPAPDVAVVRREAQAHQALLQDAASRTTSGTFARLLAAAAAGVAQHLVPLSPAPKKDAAP